MKTFLLLCVSLLAIACQGQREETTPSTLANYSNDYVLIEFASKLEEEQLQQIPSKN